MTRLSQGVDNDERNAAVLLAQLASAIEDATYYNAHPQRPETRLILDKAYRVIRKVTEFYYGDDHGLVYSPSDGRFQKHANNSPK